MVTWPMPFDAASDLKTLIAMARNPGFSSRAAEWALDDFWEAAFNDEQPNRQQHIHLANRYRDEVTGHSLVSFITHEVGHGWLFNTGYFLNAVALEGLDVFQPDAQGRNPALYALLRMDSSVQQSDLLKAMAAGLNPLAVDTHLGNSLFSGQFISDAPAIFRTIQNAADMALIPLLQQEQKIHLERLRKFSSHPAHEAWFSAKRALILDDRLPSPTERPRAKPRF